MYMRKVKITDFAEVITGGTPSTSVPEYWEDGDIPWLQSGACQNCIISDCGTFITKAGLDNSAAKMMKPDSVLIALTGATTGKVGYLTFDACANQSVTGIQPNERFVSKYLYYYLLGIRQKILDDSYGGAQKHISQGYVKNIEVPLGTIYEQQEIVDRFDRVDKLISLRKQVLRALDDIIKARFVEMFGDPLHSEKGWPSLVLCEACSSIFGGGTPSKSHPEYFTGTIPWVYPKDMKSDVIRDSIDHITEEAINNSTTNLVPINSVLMVIRSGILKHSLPVAINSVPVTINQDMKAFIPGKLILTEYLMYYFKAIESDVLSGVRGVTADNIDFKAFQQRTIIIPPMDMQNQFAAFVSQVDKSKVVVQKALDEAQLLFDSLMQKYFG